jgi:hypothetical protein
VRPQNSARLDGRHRRSSCIRYRRGRPGRLIGTLLEALRGDGVSGVHLVAGAENAGAIAFYPRVNFTPLPSPEGVQAFGRRLDA